METLLAVHGGAGYHKGKVDELCAEVLRQGKRDLIRVVKVVSFLFF